MRASGAAAPPPGNISQGAPHPTPPRLPARGAGNAASRLGPGTGGGGRAPGPATESLRPPRRRPGGASGPSPPQPAGLPSWVEGARVRAGGGGAALSAPSTASHKHDTWERAETRSPSPHRRPPDPSTMAGRPWPAGGGWAPHLYFLADASRHGAGRSARVPLEVLLRASAASAHHGALRRPPRPRPARSWAWRPLPAPGASILKNRAVTRPAPGRGCV